MSIITRVTERLDHGKEAHAFGVTDRKGREIGANVYLEFIVYEEFTPEGDCYSFSRNAPGAYFAWAGRATRGGDSFGSGSGGGLCHTEAERTAAVDQYLKSAKARAIKTSAAGK